MFDVSPVPKQVQQGGVFEQSGPSGRVDLEENVQKVIPVGREPINSEQLMGTKKEAFLEEELLAELKKDLSEEEIGALQERIEALSDTAQAYGHSLSFQLHSETQRMVVQVKDAEGEVIRQIPPEEFITLFGNLREMRGALFDTFA